MKLKYILPRLKLDKPMAEMAVSGISDDSRVVKQGDVFFVINRPGFDIFSILPDIQDKPKVFVVDYTDQQKWINSGLTARVVFVKDVKDEFQKAVDRFYRFDQQNFKFIGITGTNGKTTIAYFVYEFLQSLHQKAGLIGTINYRVGRMVYPASNTTPGYLKLRQLLYQMKSKRVKFVVMEVSSHGLAQDRVKGIKFSQCVFTNLTRDHLDYHKTMAKYFAAKKKLFTDNPGAAAIINIDDQYADKLLNLTRRQLTCSLKTLADFQVKVMKLFSWGTRFSLLYKKRLVWVNTKIVGQHNVMNILQGIAAVVALGFPLSKAIKFAAGFSGAPGRLMQVCPDIYVDYAHTPDALTLALAALRKIGYKKIICVFGCGGDRDKGKRPIMGKIACLGADFSFITSDNPRSEDAELICREIAVGCVKDNYKIILDREQAIDAALAYRGVVKHCAILVAGKGHEDYQIIGNQRFHFNDEEVIKKIVARIGKK
jgi:UDP-N-acetylmuramoyl-L-alanyl-D-glutamate--2,6-diaminopimelate ligase